MSDLGTYVDVNHGRLVKVLRAASEVLAGAPVKTNRDCMDLGLKDVFDLCKELESLRDRSCVYTDD